MDMQIWMYSHPLYFYRKNLYQYGLLSFFLRFFPMQFLGAVVLVPIIWLAIQNILFREHPCINDSYNLPNLSKFVPIDAFSQRTNKQTLTNLQDVRVCYITNCVPIQSWALNVLFHMLL